MCKKLTSFLLCLCLLLAIVLPVSATETEESDVTRLSISTVQRFLSFAENCRLDSYSENLVVSLQTDLDLSGVEFEGIPIFSGTFEGNGHTISGLDMTEDGSVQGLFRYLTDTAVVQNLNLQGNIQPGGSRSTVGAIAGSNSGKIYNCSFNGTVSGTDNIGGLVGVNTVSGVIENCTVRGVIHGSHFIGGIAGENNGVIRDCTNNAEVNTTVQQNSVELADITMDSLTNSESAKTVTDIGGIAGTSNGVIRNCTNWGNVGYQHMGYNIGGIAGTQSGYILNCVNRGKIQGRKEVGGIVGQMEPTALVEYEEDALQILQKQLNSMASVVSQTASNVSGTAENIYYQVNDLHDQVEDAKDAVGMLLPDKDDPQLPDLDTIQASKNNLSSSLSGMTQTLRGMSETTQSSMGTLSNNLHALQDQINAMRTTLGNVSETLGGSIADVSDKDSETDLSGKVESCTNYGEILGDLNIGGITGAMALENDLDPEDDWLIEGENSLNFESELRAVILNCTNTASVTGKKQSIGGIVGWQSLGLVKDSQNNGPLNAENADYVGGISGKSSGYIRSSHAKCPISGNNYVGGIAGSATIATDCRSMVKLLTGKENLGAVLGAQEDCTKDDVIDPVSGNYYLSVSTDVGGIDSISYSGTAQSLSMQDFYALENLPYMFQNVTVTFLFEGGTTKQLTIPNGGKLTDNQIPAVPEKEGYIGTWDGLDETDLSSLDFNMTFQAQYIRRSTTIQSDALRDNGLPILLLQGSFPTDAVVTVTQSDAVPTLESGETLLEVWSFTVSEPESMTAARLRLPDNCDAEEVRLLVSGETSDWRTVEHTVDGTHLVFALEATDCQIALLQTSPTPWLLILITAAALLILLVLLFLFKKKKSKKA